MTLECGVVASCGRAARGQKEHSSWSTPHSSLLPATFTLYNTDLSLTHRPTLPPFTGGTLPVDSRSRIAFSLMMLRLQGVGTIAATSNDNRWCRITQRRSFIGSASWFLVNNCNNLRRRRRRLRAVLLRRPTSQTLSFRREKARWITPDVAQLQPNRPAGTEMVAACMNRRPYVSSIVLDCIHGMKTILVSVITLRGGVSNGTSVVRWNLPAYISHSMRLPDGFVCMQNKQ